MSHRVLISTNFYEIHYFLSNCTYLSFSADKSGESSPSSATSGGATCTINSQGRASASGNLRRSASINKNDAFVGLIDCLTSPVRAAEAADLDRRRLSADAQQSIPGGGKVDGASCISSEMEMKVWRL